MIQYHTDPYFLVDTSALVHSRLAGMTMTIHMNDGQYHTALVIYDIAHILFVLPAMWCMDRFGSKRWLSILVGIGGITMLCSGLVQTPIQMIVMRFILGALAGECKRIEL
jgi:MFS family permease